MSERTSPLTLLFGSVVSGLSAAVVGPAAMYAFEALSPIAGNPAARYDAWGTAYLQGFLFGGIGILVAVFVGFPILLTLRRVRRLSLSSSAIAGAGIGLLIGMLFWLFDDAESIVLLVGCAVGACCGWVSLAVAYGVTVRPNKSLERTRDR
jgi:hypothetical protein